MRSEWKKYTFNDVCTRIYSGGTPSTQHSEYWNGNINWLSSGETGNRYIYKTERKITELGVSKSSTQLAHKGNTVVASAGQGYTRGQASYLMIDTYVNQSVIVFDANREVIDPKYLFYNLGSRYGELRQLSDGTSTRGGLSGWIVKRMEINLPPLHEQKQVVAILSKIDEKIAVNTAINENLEHQAQAIYRKMFLDNTFESWKKGVLSDIAIITMGQSPNGDTFNETGNGTVFYQGCTDFGFRFPTRRLYTTEPKRMAMCGDTLMSVRAPVGDLNTAYEECCIGRGLAAIHSKDSHQSFVLYTLYALKKQFELFNGEGTVFGSINKDSLNSMEIVIPPIELIERFDCIVNPIDRIIRNNYDEICRLQDIRNSLLPKLMNGEIDVSAVKI